MKHQNDSTWWDSKDEKDQIFILFHIDQSLFAKSHSSQKRQKQRLHGGLCQDYRAKDTWTSMKRYHGYAMVIQPANLGNDVEYIMFVSACSMLADFFSSFFDDPRRSKGCVCEITPHIRLKPESDLGATLRLELCLTTKRNNLAPEKGNSNCQSCQLEDSFIEFVFFSSRSSKLSENRVPPNLMLIVMLHHQFPYNFPTI